MSAQPAQPIKLHYFPYSGHAHRVLNFLSILGLPHELVPVNMLGGEHKAPGFLEKNAFGQLPVIEDGDLVLPDSAAILVYLAKRYDASGLWLPADPVGAARVQRWLSVAAGQLVNGAGAAWISSLRKQALPPQAGETAVQLFKLMDAHLARQDWLAGGAHPSIADLALHTYTVLAPAGGVELAPHAHLLRWIARVEALPGFVRQQGAPVLPQAA